MTEIRYPTEKWLTAYQNKHNCDRERAELVWWDNEIDHDRPTPYDLNEEQAKAVKEITKGAKSTKERKPTKRERKPDEAKRELIATTAQNLPRACGPNLESVEDIVVVNPEREIRFRFLGDEYSMVLTKHRPPKG